MAAPVVSTSSSSSISTSSSSSPVISGFPSASLSGGGSGLQLAGTDNVKISKDIDRRPLGDAVKSMVNYFLGILGFIAVLTFVYAGVLWVISAGEEEQITKAKKIMTYSALGILVIILSYSIVRFIVGSVGNTSTCDVDADCDAGYSCSNHICVSDSSSNQSSSCQSNADCPSGALCISGLCSSTFNSSCSSSLDCGFGEYCSSSGNCVQANSSSCNDNSDCTPPKQCDNFGFCHDIGASSDSHCADNSDCPTAYVCNVELSSCEPQGNGNQGANGVSGGESQSLTEESLKDVDEAVSEAKQDLKDIQKDIDSLSQEDQENIKDALNGSSLADKMENINNLIKNSTDPNTIAVLENLFNGLKQLELIREQLDSLRLLMPESEKTIQSWDDSSVALDDLIDNPTDSIKLRRFENMYRKLKELIRQFPVVKSVITASPGKGNIPFTVIFDGLNSIDPTGGTISDYKWSYLDNSGNLVSLGNSPVVVHEFTEPNTYSVRLQVSTSHKDSAGYKTAIDGVSVVRIKASPPSSKVAFRVNGVDVSDVYHITLDEARAGISFDPSISKPAIGRSIEKYEWFYGDTTDEVRTVPATVIHSYSKPGEYFVTLKITDSVGQVDKYVLKLVVKSLAANIRFVPKEGNVNTRFHFLGIDSRSDNGNVNEYKWNITDSAGNFVFTSSQENFYYTFDKPGQYNVELLVTDSTNSQDKSVRVLHIFSRKPIASFTYKIPELNHPNTVEFNAFDSYDPDQGDQITYSWDFDGDGQFEIVDSHDVKAHHIYNKVGSYKVVLQVQDSFGQRNSIKKKLIIDSVLSADILMKNKAAQVGEEIIFKVNSSNAIAYLWEFGDGITSSTEEDTVTHVYDKKGKYNVKLNFFDRDDNSNVDHSFILIGEGDSPISVAEALVDSRNQLIVEDLCGNGVDGYIVSRFDNISLSAKKSINRDGSSRMLSYDWKFFDGTHNNKRDFIYRFDEINPLGKCSAVSLVVRDEISGQVSDEDVLYFKVLNKLPNIIDFVVKGEELGKDLLTPAKVHLKVVGAKDKDGQIKKYKWWYYREGFESIPLGTHYTSSSETDMIITAEGQADVKNKYFFVVEIIDNDNGVFNSMDRFGDVSYLEVTNGPNLSPIAEFTLDKTTIAVGDSITFVSQSYDPQGDTLSDDSFYWDFDGDGAFDDTTSGSQVNRQFNTPGEFEVRLKVVNRGLSSTARRMVFVEATNSYPQAAFTYKIDGSAVHFDANSSRFDEDLDDTTLRFNWDFDIQSDFDGNGNNDDDIQSTDPKPSFTFDELKKYRVKLTVIDSLGNKGVVVRDLDLNLTEEQRKSGAYHSLGISSSNHALTTLNLSISPISLSHSNTSDVVATVINADNSSYYENVFFDILEGAGSFSPNPVKAVDGKANSVFTAVDPGSVRIRVTASSTYYGDLSEEAIINVQ